MPIFYHQHRLFFPLSYLKNPINRRLHACNLFLNFRNTKTIKTSTITKQRNMSKRGLFYRSSSSNTQSVALYTLQCDCSEEVISKFDSNQFAFFICSIKNSQKTNLSFGSGACVNVLSHKSLYKFLPKEDFMSGIIFKYGICEKKVILRPLFQLVVNVHLFDNYFIETNTLAQILVANSIYYLKKCIITTSKSVCRKL